MTTSGSAHVSKSRGQQATALELSLVERRGGGEEKGGEERGGEEKAEERRLLSVPLSKGDEGIHQCPGADVWLEGFPSLIEATYLCRLHLPI